MTSARGFTLIELIVVVVILGIIATMTMSFIALPVNAYLSTNRRAQLSDVADNAIRRVARDLRQALPNSVRAGGGGANRYLEFVPTTGGARYRGEAGAGRDHLDFSEADSSFDYLGTALAGSTGFVAVFNTGQRSASGCASGGADVYEGCNRSAITAASATNIAISPRQFMLASPGNRFHVIPAAGPVTLACENVGIAGGTGTGTLRMYTGYAGSADWGASARSTAPAGAAQVSVLATTLSACSLVYVSGISASNGLVTLHLSISRSGETLSLHHQVHIDNVP